MNKLMLKCPKTGKLLFTGHKVGSTDLKQIKLGVMGTTIIPCLHCGQDHDMKKEKLSLVPDGDKR
jgi:hypothetical protein